MSRSDDALKWHLAMRGAAARPVMAQVEACARYRAKADRSPLGPRPKGLVHESGGPEGICPNEGET